MEGQTLKVCPFYHRADHPLEEVTDTIHRSLRVKLDSIPEVKQYVIGQFQPQKRIWVFLYSMDDPKNLHACLERSAVIRWFNAKQLSWAIASCSRYEKPTERPPVDLQAQTLLKVDAEFGKLKEFEFTVLLNASVDYREKAGVQDKTEVCIRMVVPTKGLIPVFTKPFDKSINGIPTDVVGIWPKVPQPQVVP